MKKLAMTIALACGLMVGSASADQTTLKAIQDEGVSLTNEQTSALESTTCVSDDCTDLVNVIAGIIGFYSGNDTAIESIFRAVSSVHPELVSAIGEAAMALTPDDIALIAGLMTEFVPTAAGGTTGLTTAAQTLANNSIPTPPGGGGSSSPN